jgi:thiol-disulfide isomerase/thioredoxin
VEELVLGARIVLAGVFATAGAAKLADLAGSRQAVAGFGLPARAAAIVGTVLPLAELATAAALVAQPTARAGGVAALALLLAFIAGIGSALARGRAPDCHCFGQLHSAPAGRGTLLRNVALAVPAALIVLEGPGPSIGSWVSEQTSAELVAVGAAAAALLLGLLALGLWLSNRELREDLGRAEADLAALPPGLPVGASAPNFTLPDPLGEQHTLESLWARGRPVALVFVSPDCEACQGLLPNLGRWQRMLADRLTVAVITSGGSRNDQLGADQHGITDVLVQEDSEVMSAYRVPSTPSAVAVTAEGTIASTPAEGPLAIEPLIRLTLKRAA